MKKHLILAASLLGLALTPFSAFAQNTPSAAESYQPQVAGLRELTLGGSGSSNTDMDSSFGSLDFSYGVFMSPLTEGLIRQTISYSNPNNGDDGWNGSTRLAYDWHFDASAPIRPFVGVNAGRVYGNNVNDMDRRARSRRQDVRADPHLRVPARLV